jgi:mono/diheme cytochrome c family protein
VFLLLLLLALLLGIGGVASTSSTRSLGSEAVDVVTAAARLNGITDPEALDGARVYAESGCVSCHTYRGTGSSNLGAPDLTAEGAKGKGVQFQLDHLRCPSCVNPGSPMPPFRALGASNLRKLAVFLEASKG